MYERFFDLRERPFELTSDPRFLYRTACHREALANLEYGVSRGKPVTLLTGEPGTGKSTLLRAAMHADTCRHVRWVYVANPVLTRDEFITLLAGEFELSACAASSKSALLGELRGRLLECRATGEAFALVIDEAQAMSPGLLEEVRLLGNLENETDRLLPIVLAGHPEFVNVLAQPSLLPLRQRIALRCTVGSFNVAETASYIASRLRTAGRCVPCVHARRGDPDSRAVEGDRAHDQRGVRQRAHHGVRARSPSGGQRGGHGGGRRPSARAAETARTRSGCRSDARIRRRRPCVRSCARLAQARGQLEHQPRSPHGSRRTRRNTVSYRCRIYVRIAGETRSTKRSFHRVAAAQRTGPPDCTRPTWGSSSRRAGPRWTGATRRSRGTAKQADMIRQGLRTALASSGLNRSSRGARVQVDRRAPEQRVPQVRGQRGRGDPRAPSMPRRGGR